MKTRIEILESDYDSAQTQLVENEINIRVLNSRIITTPPGEEYNAMQKSISTRKTNVTQIKQVMGVILEMIEEEKKACQVLN
jgi:hypothetical protein